MEGGVERSETGKRLGSRMAWGVAETLQPTQPGKTKLKRWQSFWGRAVMKNRFLGSLALAAMIAGPATAADLPYKAPPALPVAYYDWSGIYGGFSVEQQQRLVCGRRLRLHGPQGRAGRRDTWR